MMRIVTIFIVLSILLISCSTQKQIAIAPKVVKVDTTAAPVSPSNQPTPVITPTTLFTRITANKISCKTFSGKVRMQYEMEGTKDEATAYIRITADSAIWLSLRGALGIEGFRILITKDSLTIIDLLKKNVQYRSFDFFKETTGLPLDFATVQNIIIGNPVFLDSNHVSSPTHGNNPLQILMKGNNFTNLLTVDTSDNKILASNIEVINGTSRQKFVLSYSNFDNSAGSLFSTTRKIAFALPAATNINLDFKQYSFNQPVTFPFNIPRNFKKL